jgi:hypothetical protein
MGLKDILKKHNIPIPEDFDERLEILVSGLKKKSNFHSKLSAFKKHRPTSGPHEHRPTSGPHGHRGGADPEPPPLTSDSEDYLGPRLRWFLEAMTSPYARTLMEGVFMVVFFISYLEKMPVFGSVLAASLDVILAGGKMLTKSVQSILPAMIGVIPLPYASMAGIAMASLFGFIVWPIIALVSLSRKDFVAAVESFIRIIPPPVGDMIANTFLEGNRAVAKVDEKRVKLGNDISNALRMISETFTTLSSTMKEGVSKLAEQTREAAQQVSTMPTVPPMPKLPTVPPMPNFHSPTTIGGFHRRSRRKTWRTKTTRRKLETL